MKLNPPTALRGRVLAASLTRRPPDRAVPPVAPADPSSCLHRQIGAVQRLLATVPPAGWHRPVERYPWTVHGLVGHLVGVETYLGGELGIWPFTPTGGETDHIGVTEPFVAATATAAPGATVDRWSLRAGVVAERLQQRWAEDPGQRVAFHGIPVSVANLLVVRAFELWTHAEDIRAALGTPPEAPVPADVAAMADLSIRLLVMATPFVAPHQVERPARVVLTGPGGGVWRIGPPAAAPETRVVADIVAWCRMAGRRLAPDDLGGIVAGDTDLAQDLFAATRLLVS
jgi:uncharacterized protein (TIGR03083 family)